MGIPGASQAFKGQRLTLRQSNDLCRGKRVLVDGPPLLYLCQGGSMQDQVSAMYRWVVEAIEALQPSTMVLVWDGASNAQKDAAREFFGRNSEFVGEFRRLALSDDLTGAGQLHALTWTQRAELPRALQALLAAADIQNVQFVWAPGEADAQIAQMDRELEDAKTEAVVLSRDADLTFVLGVRVQLRGFPRRRDDVVWASASWTRAGLHEILGRRPLVDTDDQGFHRLAAVAFTAVASDAFPKGLPGVGPMRAVGTAREVLRRLDGGSLPSSTVELAALFWAAATDLDFFRPPPDKDAGIYRWLHLHVYPALPCAFVVRGAATGGELTARRLEDLPPGVTSFDGGTHAMCTDLEGGDKLRDFLGGRCGPAGDTVDVPAYLHRAVVLGGPRGRELDPATVRQLAAAGPYHARGGRRQRATSNAPPNLQRRRAAMQRGFDRLHADGLVLSARVGSVKNWSGLRVPVAQAPLLLALTAEGGLTGLLKQLKKDPKATLADVVDKLPGQIGRSLIFRDARADGAWWIGQVQCRAHGNGGTDIYLCGLGSLLQREKADPDDLLEVGFLRGVLTIAVQCAGLEDVVFESLTGEPSREGPSRFDRAMAAHARLATDASVTSRAYSGVLRLPEDLSPPPGTCEQLHAYLHSDAVHGVQWMRRVEPVYLELSLVRALTRKDGIVSARAGVTLAESTGRVKYWRVTGHRYTGARDAALISRGAGRVSNGKPRDDALQEVEEECSHAYTFSDEVLVTLFGKTTDELGVTPTHLRPGVAPAKVAEVVRALRDDGDLDNYLVPLDVP